MTDWQNDAHAMFGPNWRAPLAMVLGVHARTVERWCHGIGSPSVELVGWLADTVERVPAGACLLYGDLLKAVYEANTDDPVKVLRMAAEDIDKARVPRKTDET